MASPQSIVATKASAVVPAAVVVKVATTASTRFSPSVARIVTGSPGTGGGETALLIVMLSKFVKSIGGQARDLDHARARR